MLQPRPGRPEAAELIWDWRAAASKAPIRPSARALRVKGTIQALVVASVATLFWFFGPRGLATGVFGVAGVLLASALLSPTGVYETIQRAVDRLGYAIGVAVTWISMALVFYLAFFPFGVLFRRGRRDALKRFYEADAATYWVERGEGRRVSPSRTRQY